jgi:hypothetical protein
MCLATNWSYLIMSLNIEQLEHYQNRFAMTHGTMFRTEDRVFYNKYHAKIIYCLRNTSNIVPGSYRMSRTALLRKFPRADFRIRRERTFNIFTSDPDVLDWFLTEERHTNCVRGFVTSSPQLLTELEKAQGIAFSIKLKTHIPYFIYELHLHPVGNRSQQYDWCQDLINFLAVNRDEYRPRDNLQVYLDDRIQNGYHLWGPLVIYCRNLEAVTLMHMRESENIGKIFKLIKKEKQNAK